MFRRNGLRSMLFLAGVDRVYGSGTSEPTPTHYQQSHNSQLTVTAAASLLYRSALRNLYDRQITPQVIGFYNGDELAPATCPAGYTASSAFTSGGYWACCGSPSCYAPVTCLDYTRHTLTLASAYDSLDAVYCGSASEARYCQRDYLVDDYADTYTSNVCGPTSPGRTRTIYQYIRSTTSITRTVSPTSVSLSRAAFSTPISTTSSSSATSSSTSDSTSEITTSSPTSTAASSPTAPAIETTAASDSTNVGAIAGGVIGGVATLGLVVSGIAVWLRRKRKQRRLAGTGAITQYEPEQEPKHENVVATQYTPPQEPRHEMY